MADTASPRMMTFISLLKVFELPNPTVGKKWYPAIDTHSGEFFTVPPKKKRKRKIKSEKQLFREYMVEPRSIVVFVGR